MSKYAWQYLIEGVLGGFLILGAISEYLWYRWEKENHLDYYTEPKDSFGSIDEEEEDRPFDWERD